MNDYDGRSINNVRVNTKKYEKAYYLFYMLFIALAAFRISDMIYPLIICMVFNVIFMMDYRLNKDYKAIFHIIISTSVILIVLKRMFFL